MRGRKPKPPEVKEVLGNPGHRPIPPSTPPPAEAGDGIIERPKFLKGKAAKVWDFYVPRMPWLKSVDAHCMAAWCVLVAEFEKDAGKMTASRITQMRTFGSLLGLDPSTRGRLSASSFEKPPAPESANERPAKDPAEKYFAPSRAVN